MALVVLLVFLLLPAGGISGIYLAVKAFQRATSDPKPAPAEGEKIAWVLLVLGLLALLFIYVVGGAMAVQ